MRLFPLALMLVLMCLAGVAHGQTISIDHIDGLLDDTYLATETPIVFHIRMAAGPDHHKGLTNGWRIYSGDGADWDTTLITKTDALNADEDNQEFDLTYTVKKINTDGMLSDTVGVVGAVMFNPVGMPPDFDSITHLITIGPIDPAFDGTTICIDSCFYYPSGTWKWADINAIPTWDGPFCYEIKAPDPTFPEFTDCPVTIIGGHCDPLNYQLAAEDPDSDLISYAMVSGVGQVGESSGLWSYTPTLADVGASLAAEVEACDATGCGTSCQFDLLVTNQAPELIGGTNTADAPYTVGMGGSIGVTLIGDPVDCDPLVFGLLSVTPTPVGDYSLIGNVLTFNPADPDDVDMTFDFEVVLGDGGPDSLTATGHVHIQVIPVEMFEIQIEKIHNAIQGMYTRVDVILNSGSDQIGGFDILIAYDASALTFASAVEGDLYDCGWEYFNYRMGPFGNCGNGCPSGQIRIVGIAETNNGAHHPDFDCAAALIKPYTMFSLDFLVTDDRTFECMYVPIQFFWMDCGDNSLAYSTVDDPLASIQGVSRFVYNYGVDPMIEMSDSTTGFPTYTGVQAECLVGGGDGKPAPIQFVDFINGGIDIVCADSIDARGDINLNGEANEIADAVLFSNYFVHGLGVFIVNVAGQTAASDVNADGAALTVADLVYLIRIVVGDALPYPKLSPVEAGYSAQDGILSVDSPMGAVWIVLDGDVSPELLASQMDMSYSFDGANTRVLVSSMRPGVDFEGPFLATDGQVIAIEMATYEGTPVVAKVMPSGYRLQANYPNPFNPVTHIGFSLPTSGDYSLKIYNITGQEVALFTGAAEAGQHEIVWDASHQASGVYFYRLDAGEFSETRKMVLLK